MATGLLGLALVLGTGTPSSASSSDSLSAGQPPVLSVSLDGQHWTPELERPLFDGDRRWVPGDNQTVSIWVRNLTRSAAALDLGLEPAGDSWSTADLDLSARVDGQPVQAQPGTGARRIDPITGPTRIDLTVTMSQQARERAQRRQAPFSVRLRLAETGADADPTLTTDAAVLPGLSEPVGGHLPGTGTPPFGVPITLVGLAAAVRAALAARRSHQIRKEAL